MKLPIILGLGLAVGCANLHGAPLMTEQFVYTAGGLAAQSGGNWNTLNSGVEAVVSDTAAITASGLAAGRGVTARHASAGGYEHLRSVSGMNSTDGTSAYVSFWLRVESVDALSASGADVSFALAISGSTWPSRLLLSANTDTNHFDLGIAANSPTTPAYVPATQNLNVKQDYFVVLGVDTVAGTANNVAKLWLNPSTGLQNPPVATASATNTGTEPSGSLTGVIIRQGTNQRITFTLDEIRVGNAWTDITFPGVPVNVSSFTID